MIIIVGVFQVNACVLVDMERQAIKVGVYGRAVIVIAAGMDVLERRYKECLQQGKASRYRDDATHPLSVYRRVGQLGV